MKKVNGIVALAAVAGLALSLLVGCADAVTGGGAAVDVVLTELAASSSSISINVGDTRVITLTGTYSDGTTAAVSDATWESASAGVASVASGTITGVSAGSATVTATKGGKSVSVSVTVSAVAVAAPKYIYSATGATADISCVWDAWSSGTTTTDLTTDPTYAKVLQVTSGTGWGNAFAVAFTKLGNGQVSEYTTIKFKIKTSDYTSVKVKVPATGGSEEFTYQLSAGTALADGWVQMSVPVSDFGANAYKATEMAILSFGAGVVYLTDICLEGTGVVDTSALAADLTAAQANLAAHSAGSADGNVPQAKWDALNAAITAAQAVTTGTPSAQSQVTAVYTPLKAAEADFLASIIQTGPTAVATAPTVDTSNAIVLSSSDATYAAAAVSVSNFFQFWWNNSNSPAAAYAAYDIGGKTVRKYSNLVAGGCFGIVPTAVIDATSKTKKMHVDVFVPAGTEVKFKIVTDYLDGNSDPIGQETAAQSVTAGSWTSLDVDLTALTSLDGKLDKVKQIGVINATGCSTIYLDNLYFY